MLRPALGRLSSETPVPEHSSADTPRTGTPLPAHQEQQLVEALAPLTVAVPRTLGRRVPSRHSLTSSWMFILEPDARRAAGRHKQEPWTRCSGRAASADP